MLRKAWKDPHRKAKNPDFICLIVSTNTFQNCAKKATPKVWMLCSHPTNLQAQRSARCCGMLQDTCTVGRICLLFIFPQKRVSSKSWKIPFLWNTWSCEMAQHKSEKYISNYKRDMAKRWCIQAVTCPPDKKKKLDCLVALCRALLHGTILFGGGERVFFFNQNRKKTHLRRYETSRNAKTAKVKKKKEKEIAADPLKKSWGKQLILKIWKQILLKIARAAQKSCSGWGRGWTCRVTN